MSADPEFVQGTLDWCNKRRVADGKEPLDRLPKGTRGDGRSCPCGQASGLYVGARGWKTGDEMEAAIGGWRPLPQPVVEFVEAFDNGELPQYDIDPDDGRTLL